MTKLVTFHRITFVLALFFIFIPCVYGQTGSDVEFTYFWVPLHSRNGVIIAAGPYQLPLSLSLPNGLTPLGNQAFVSTVDHTHNPLVVTLYFPSRQENKVLNWEQHLAGNYPFPPGTYSPRVSYKEIKGKNNMWFKNAGATMTHGYVSLAWMGEPGSSDPAWKSPPAEMQTELNTLFGVHSPVTHERRLIYLSVDYSMHHK